jgi:hypothetical protein
MPFAQASKRFAEQREFPRHRVHRPASIDFEDGSPIRDCTLWDVSEAGVRITVAAPSEIPQEFCLVLSDDRATRRRCRVIWRSDEQIGACYLGAPDWSWTA